MHSTCVLGKRARSEVRATRKCHAESLCYARDDEVGFAGRLRVLLDVSISCGSAVIVVEPHVQGAMSLCYTVAFYSPGHGDQQGSGYSVLTSTVFSIHLNFQ